MADRHGSRGPRMAKHWHIIPAISQAMSADGTFSGGALSLDGPFTVLRMLGSYLIRATGNVTAAESAYIGVAIGVVSSDAFAAGAASLPDPLGEPEFPWLYWSDNTVFYGGTQSPWDGKAGAGMVRVEFDIRSMRKLKPRESLVSVFQYADNVGAPGVTIDFCRTRVLVAT